MNALTFKLTLLQPLLIGQLGVGEENSAISFDYIAGSTIRGALIGCYTEQNGADLDVTDSEVRRLFFNDKVIYLNGYLQDERGRRTLPTPRSWMVEKDNADQEAEKIVDTAIDDITQMAALQSLSVPFCSPEEDETTLYAPKRQSGLHNASTKRYVKQENDSVVFRYDALAAGQTFCAAILGEDITLLAVLQALLNRPALFLGRSRSAGYGHTAISEVRLTKDWQEYELPTPADPPAVITLTLLSDAILRGACGQYTADLQSLPTIQNLGVKPTACFVTTRLTGGFNRKWGLPLPQMPVIKAGSLWAFPNTEETAAALQTLVATGIGERRSEGFGRVAVKWQQYRRLKQRAPIVVHQRSTTVALTGAGQTLAARMTHRLYRQRLDHLLLQHIAGPFAIGGAVPENSQLARLRIIVRRAWREKDLKAQLIKNFLGKLKAPARNQYLQARVERQSLLQWLEEGWQNDKLWKEYFYISPTDLPQIGNVQAQQTDELKLEYSVRLVDALCDKAIRERQAKAQRHSQPTAEVTR
jgi:CRISPR-associated protein Csx10